VYVVAGRLRYHRDGCSLLEGRATDALVPEEAREEGFSPCSRCLPPVADDVVGPQGSGGSVTTSG
jgi:hypothetical protein